MGVIDTVGTSSAETLLSGHTGTVVDRWGGLGSLPLQCSPSHVVSMSHLASCVVHRGSKFGAGVGVGNSVSGSVAVFCTLVDVGASKASSGIDSVGTSRLQAVTRVTIVRFALQAPPPLHDAVPVVIVQELPEGESD